MPHISRRRIDPNVRKDMFDSFTFIFKEINRKSEMEEFLTSVMTETEKTMLAKRVVVAFLLKNKVEEASIADLLKVTPSTVSRMKLWIQTHQTGFDIIFKKLNKEQRLRIGKQIFYRLLRYSIKASSGRVPMPF